MLFLIFICLTFVDVSYGMKSSGVPLQETLSEKVCGIDTCSKPLTIEEKLKGFLNQNNQINSEINNKQEILNKISSLQDQINLLYEKVLGLSPEDGTSILQQGVYIGKFEISEKEGNWSESLETKSTQLEPLYGLKVSEIPPRITFDKETYLPNDQIQVMIYDFSRNQNPNEKDVVEIYIRSMPLSERRIYETNENTGIFSWNIKVNDFLSQSSVQDYLRIEYPYDCVELHCFKKLYKTANIDLSEMDGSIQSPSVTFDKERYSLEDTIHLMISDSSRNRNPNEIEKIEIYFASPHRSDFAIETEINSGNFTWEKSIRDYISSTSNPENVRIEYSYDCIFGCSKKIIRTAQIDLPIGYSDNLLDIWMAIQALQNDISEIKEYLSERQ